MKPVICSPYLPLYEHIPDSESHVFDRRLYIYDSHDASDGNRFCLEDYVVWSVSVDDLNQWCYGNISYRRGQDPHNMDGKQELFAPDAVKGSDGRCYLFYRLRMQQGSGVAVSENLAGLFMPCGHIHYPDGSIFWENMPYDSVVPVDDNGRIYLYYGYTSEVIAAKLGATVSPGCMVVELKPDMVTAAGALNICLSRDVHTEGIGLGNHGCYEGPSIREMSGRYHLVFSSEVYHELCCAVSNRSRDGFVYGDVVVFSGDIGIYGWQYPVCLPGNSHRGLVCIKGQYYMFYQHHTQYTQFPRQRCVELASILSDGSIPQVEMTPSGLNDGPLPAKGVRPVAYACHLTHTDGEKMLRYWEADPAVPPSVRGEAAAVGEEVGDSCIYSITDGAAIGFRYFQADPVGRIALVLRGICSGRFMLYSDKVAEERILAAVPMGAEPMEWQKVSIPVTWDGVHALYLRYQGGGSADLKELEFGEQEE